MPNHNHHHYKRNRPNNMNNNNRYKPLNPPDRMDLPFCAYGIFKPGQLAYSKIENYVKKHIPCEIKYKMLLRDGVPLIEYNTNNNSWANNYTNAYLIYFEKDSEFEAYNIISKTTCGHLYNWETIQVDNIEANVLMGRKPNNGSSPEFDSHDFKGEKDPFFKEVLELIKENLDNHKRHGFGDEFEDTIKDFFTLQMNYMLLWSAIERFSNLKYYCPTKKENNKKFANEPLFIEGLKKYVGRTNRSVYSAEDLKKYYLDITNPQYALNYYYTLRCNMVHRGKAAPRDRDMIKTSLEELLNIFKDILEDTFKEDL